MIRRIVGLAVVALTWGAVLTFARPASADHWDGTPNVITWNMCNGQSAPCNNDATDLPARDLVNAVEDAQFKPMAIMLQEVCLASRVYLFNELTPLGYSSAYINSNTMSSRCKEHGNVVMWLGGCYGGTASSCSARAYYPAGDQHANDDDTRGWVCGRGAFPSFTSCSTHLTQKSDQVAGQQSERYRTLVSFYAGITPMTNAGGDFNIVGPNGVQYWHQAWLESDDPLWRATHQSEGKIDFIFTPRSQCRPRLAELVDTIRSDHHRLYGYPKAQPC